MFFLKKKTKIIIFFIAQFYGTIYFEIEFYVNFIIKTYHCIMGYLLLHLYREDGGWLFFVKGDIIVTVDPVKKNEFVLQRQQSIRRAWKSKDNDSLTNQSDKSGTITFRSQASFHERMFKPTKGNKGGLMRQLSMKMALWLKTDEMPNFNDDEDMELTMDSNESSFNESNFIGTPRNHNDINVQHNTELLDTTNFKTAMKRTSRTQPSTRSIHHSSNSSPDLLDEKHQHMPPLIMPKTLKFGSSNNKNKPSPASKLSSAVTRALAKNASQKPIVPQTARTHTVKNQDPSRWLAATNLARSSRTRQILSTDHSSRQTTTSALMRMRAINAFASNRTGAL